MAAGDTFEFTVRIAQIEYSALVVQAEQELRSPEAQLRTILIESMMEDGLLPDGYDPGLLQLSLHGKALGEHAAELRRELQQNGVTVVEGESKIVRSA